MSRHATPQPPIVRYKGAATDSSVRVFSNLFPLSTPLVFQGVAFPSSEHLYKWVKCRFFGDQGSAGKVLETENPRDLLPMAKYKSAKWSEIQETVMRAILLVKFTSSATLKDRLLATGQARLVEDTIDPLWGRGRDGKGKNLHGRCLMEARAAMRNGSRRPSTIVIGDSLLTGISLAGAQVVCIRGAQASMTCLLAELLAQDPRVSQLIIHVGTNDIFPRLPDDLSVQQVRQRQRSFVGALGSLSRRTPDVNISVSLLLPRWCDRNAAPNLQRSATYNDTLVTKLKQLREKGANVTPIDHRPVFAAAEGDWFAPDGLHLSAKGRDRFADILRRSAVL
jgi:ribA/ribD-fused uncharacterized protein